MVALSLGDFRDALPDRDTAPLVWVLHDGKAGMASQAIGLAEAAGFPFIEKGLAIRAPWAWLPPQLWARPLAAATGARLAPPWPDLVIGCGRNTVMPALAIRRASRGHTAAVQLQDPRIGHAEFDLMVVPEHDRLRGPRVITTLGAIHRVTPARLAAARRRFPALDTLPRPVVALLIGGSNRSYRLDLGRLGEIADVIAVAVRSRGGSLVVTPSRRTGETGLALLRQRLAGVPAAVWDGTGDNPYFAYLAVADTVLVTADSVSMVSEAAATGKPVYILDLPGGDAKFTRFHAALRAAGITRPFTGLIETWSYVPPDDNTRAGAAVRELVLARQPPSAPR
jgi:mitochondrial fission protein ELM1